MEATHRSEKNNALLCVQPVAVGLLRRCYTRGAVMLTDLFAASSSISADVVLRSIPPDVRRPIVSARDTRREGDDVVVEFPPFAPRRPAVHFVPSFSALTGETYSARFEAAAADTGEAGWIATASLGPDEFLRRAFGHGVLRSEIDVLVASRPLDAIRLRLRLRSRAADAVLAAPWLVTLSTSDGGVVDSSGGRDLPASAIDVPARSQMEESEAVRNRICSPTSVAMVLALHGHQVRVTDLAAEMYHPPLDLYGVWPCAIQAAARRGIAGYLLRFPGWTAAAWCLMRGLPIVASVRYAAGELTDAAIPATSGHLLVLTGLEGNDVMVNDPAAPSRAQVRRRYDRGELTRVWLERAGVGYVFFPPR